MSDTPQAPTPYPAPCILTTEEAKAIARKTLEDCHLDISPNMLESIVLMIALDLSSAYSRGYNDGLTNLGHALRQSR